MRESTGSQGTDKYLSWELLDYLRLKWPLNGINNAQQVTIECIPQIQALLQGPARANDRNDRNASLNAGS